MNLPFPWHFAQIPRWLGTTTNYDFSQTVSAVPSDGG